MKIVRTVRTVCIPISIRLSKPQAPVVPSVADTKNGYRPFAKSASIAFKYLTKSNDNI